MGTEKQKQSLYFAEDMLREIMREANRLDRSLSWTVQQAWRLAREEVRKFPSVDTTTGRDSAQRVVPRPPPAPRLAAERPGEGSEQVREFLRGRFDRDAS